MAENKKLGKGLNDILKDYNLLEEVAELENSPKEQQLTLDITLIDPNPFQPRIVFNQEKLNELVASIKVHGVFTPVLVTINQDRYTLVAGERRLRAAKLAGLKTIPAVIVEFTSEQMLEVALIENIQREELNIIEEARGYKMMITELNYSQEVIARRVGKSRPHITNLLRALSLPSQTQEDLLASKLTFGQVKPLIGLKEDVILELTQKIKKEKWSARKTENFIKYKYRKPTTNQWQLDLINLLAKHNLEVTFTKNSFKVTYKSDLDVENFINLISKN